MVITTQNRSPQSIKQMFNKISPRYDFLNHLLSLGIDYKWRRTLANLCPRNGFVLDICTGTGDLAFAIHKTSGSRVLCTDFAKEMIMLAKRKSHRHKLNGLMKFANADALKLPFPDKTFDAVTVAFGIRNTADIEKCLREMARITKPNGKILILDFSEPDAKLIRSLYSLYFYNILPLVGGVISGERYAYKYLPNSVSKFPKPSKMKAIMQKCGLADVKYIPLTFGVAILYMGNAE